MFNPNEVINKLFSFNSSLKTSFDKEIIWLYQNWLRNLKIVINLSGLSKLIQDLKVEAGKYRSVIYKYFDFVKCSVSKIENLEKWFYYCVLTKGVDIERTYYVCKVLQEIRFSNEDELYYKLKLTGFRFSKDAAKAIVAIKNNIDVIYELVWNSELPGFVIRKELMKIIPGMGIKRISLALREIRQDVAPIDIHVFNFLRKYHIYSMFLSDIV